MSTKQKRAKAQPGPGLVKASSNPPPVDIILPTHDHLDLTTRAVEALYANTKAPFHLIVVDDSTDATPQYFGNLKEKRDNITFIHSNEPFKSGNQFFNLALTKAKHQYVATVMNSVQVEPGWEIVALQLMEQDPQIGIIGFKCLFPNNHIESAGIRMHGFTPVDIGRDEPSHRHTTVNEVEAVQWAFALMRKTSMLGSLDENTYHGFVGWDDIDNSFVLKSKGWKVVYCGMGVGYHWPRATRGDNSPEAALKNKQNAETFYKRWGFWELYLQSNPIEVLRKDIAEIKETLKLLVNGKKDGSSPSNGGDRRTPEEAVLDAGWPGGAGPAADTGVPGQEERQGNSDGDTGCEPGPGLAGESAAAT